MNGDINLEDEGQRDLGLIAVGTGTGAAAEENAAFEEKGREFGIAPEDFPLLSLAFLSGREFGVGIGRGACMDPVIVVPDEDISMSWSSRGAKDG